MEGPSNKETLHNAADTSPSDPIQDPSRPGDRMLDDMLSEQTRCEPIEPVIEAVEPIIEAVELVIEVGSSAGMNFVPS